MATTIDVVVFKWNVVKKIVRREIGEIVGHLPRRKKSAASQTVATARTAPKICRGSLQQCAHTHSTLDFIKIGSLSAES